MSTLAEIEIAIETLSAAQVEELTAWLDQRRKASHSGESSHEQPKSNQRKSLEDYFGCFYSGDPQSGDNERIDADIARELNKKLGAA